MLGYPTVKIAQSARSRLRARIRDILRAEEDVSFMFDLLKGCAPPPPVTDPNPDAGGERWQINEPSPDYARSTLDRVCAIEALNAREPRSAEPSGWWGSFADHFARSAANEHACALWGRALRLPVDEVARIASGRRTILELDPDIAAVAGMLLGIPAEDMAGLALANVGLRPSWERV